ncbi:MAG: hypothetical protein H7A32_06095 [Deltaproteobacteria bacterium]|nr:hypothetical protein [Deltaproteobacteria bacterium]
MNVNKEKKRKTVLKKQNFVKIFLLVLVFASLYYIPYFLDKSSSPEGISIEVLSRAANQHNENDLAIRLVKSSVTKPKWFLDNKELTDALGNLVIEYNDSIFEYFTLDQSKDNLISLANLMRIILFNHESKYSQQLHQQILLYSKKLQKKLNQSSDNNSADFLEASTRLETLSAASDIAMAFIFEDFIAQKNSLFTMFSDFKSKEFNFNQQAQIQGKLKKDFVSQIKNSRDRFSIVGRADALANRLSSK